MKLEDINTNTEVKLGNRVYLAEDLFKLFDVRNIKYSTLEDLE